ncbi:MAG TPA: hypothetical protein VLT16_15600 [Candidatus Limnocylindrales bacterium]|nr:hypothetical protein [Candidatus Limnocylindrales bacterium]
MPQIDAVRGAQRCGVGDGDGLGDGVAAGAGVSAGLGVGVGVGVMSDEGMVEGVSVEGVGVGDGLGLCCTVTGDWVRTIRQKSSVAARHRNIG